MSHYTVLVIGKNPEKQLAPYHEYECDGEDDEYIQDIDETESKIKEFEKDHSKVSKGDYSKYETFEQYLTEYCGIKEKGGEEDKWGYYEKDKKGNIIKVINRTNPNSKWDYYRLGGRWNGFFNLNEDVLVGNSEVEEGA